MRKGECGKWESREGNMGGEGDTLFYPVAQL